MRFRYIILHLCVSAALAFGPQPRIITQDGNLIFKPGDNKNIQFVTNGDGKIFLNDGDLTNAANLARNASMTLERFNSDYYNTYFQIQKFNRIIEGRSGILSRLSVLETGMKNSTNGSFADRGSLPVINRKIRLLQRKVNRLIRLLTKNECASSPCKNGGTCQDLFNGYVCQCPDEWEGPTCDKDTNECARFAGTDLGCQNGATCVNKIGSYECLCSHGWFGIHCTRQSTSCTTGSVSELCGHGTCIPQNNGIGYKCLCDQGWTTDGTNLACMVDVDECISNVPSCSKNPLVACVNTPGSFKCGNCPAGYIGNGYYCNDIDECAIFNGGCSVNPMVRCINTLGSKVCGSCPPGYIGDGTSCAFRGICGINNGGCHYLAQCRDNPSISSTYVECICPRGYVGAGIGVNGCIQSSQSGNTCASNPCLFGTCIENNATGSYICQCRRRYTGRNCDIRKDPCQPNPCSHGGTCQTILDISFKCVCTPDYTGSTCNVQKQACGGLVKGSTGSVKFPQTHSHVYGTSVSCAWIIQTNATQVLNITFTHLNLQDSTNCRYDWIQIHDGSNTAAQSFGRFCGTALPHGGNIISTHNRIYMWLRVDSTIKDPGFELNWNSINPLCGEIVAVTSHGTLRSPGHPGNYPLNRDCYWYLSAPLGKRLQFHFFSLMIGESANCTKDYITFYQGLTVSDKILAKYCNTSHPEPLYSAGPEVMIHFHSDASETYPGFQISYSVIESIPGCGGVYTSSSGEISSPIENGRYPPDITCDYKIQVPQNLRIKLIFLNFDLEDEPNCSFDSLAIHEGGSSTSPLVNKYCGKRMPPSYTSIGNQIFIVFTSDWSNKDDGESGFRIKYSTICGGTYTKPSGVIESPGYPESYREDQICIYEIMQPLGTTITLTFTEFEMEESTYSECMFDFIEIRDGDNENSTLIGQYCKESPPVIESTYNYLWIKFESDSSVGAHGFRANYTTLDVGCGGILKSPSGVIKSVSDAGSYVGGSTCMWVIAAPPGYAIQLTWVMFHLEESSTCGFDYVEVYNNHTVSELMGRYCGNKVPPTLISSSNVVTVKFVSDQSLNYEGFILSYALVDEESACGGSYFTSTGVIKSPFYPNDYPSNRECNWVITVNSTQQILLNITEFQLEYSTECTYDYIEIRNGGTSSSPLIGKYCGTEIPKEIPSHANQLHLTFHTDPSHEDKGFKIIWESTSTGCGGTLTSPKGSIISPFYPEPYIEDTDCNWKISVSAGSIIQIVFVDLELENNEDCEMDFVQIYDGPNLNSKSLGKFCKNAHVPFLLSTTNVVRVLFRSDSSVQAKGFHLQYNTLCRNSMKGYKGVIESPNFPINYPFPLDCSWTVEVAAGNKINITFAQFDLVSALSATGCPVNYIKIRYKSEDDLEMIDYGIYCGIKPSFVITINSNVAEIHFVSNSSLVGNGFRLEWQIEGCGGVLTKPSDTIMTPNYPKGYPKGTQCEWLIQVDYGHSIEITFHDVDFELESICMYDYILVTNGIDDTYPVLTKTCSKAVKPVTVTSTGNFMFVKFSSDFSYTGKGFWANYTSVETKCGGKLSTFSGSFNSPNYPKNYDNSEFCEWLIEVEDNHVIELTFHDLDLSENCNTDFIKIYDGPSAGYSLLHKICGKTKPELIKSTRNYMTVILQSGNQFTAKGFLANYSIACGATIETQNSGILNLHDVVLNMLPVNNCSWTIINSIPSQHVTLVVTQMASFDCTDSINTLKIYNGESEKSPLIGKYCDDIIPGPITSSGNALHIQVSNIAMNFMAQYYMVDTDCGGIFNGETGAITTPRYPSSYPMNVQCEWTIKVAAGNELTLSFIEFDLVPSQNCHLDYVEIREGKSHGKLIGSYCNESPKIIKTIGTVWILFKSSLSTQDGATGKGFLAQYSLVHGVNLEGPFGNIASPLYPNYYYKTDTFSWTITVEFGKAVMVSFIDFYLETYSDEECFGSKLEVYDGYDTDAPLLREICGLTLPESIKSTSNIINIKMNYDSVRRGSRFLLEWIEIDIESKTPSNTNKEVEGCGSNDIIDMTDVVLYDLTSPGYPNGYDVNLNCEWIFSTKPGHHIVINFVKVDLEVYGDTCLSDTVKIYNKVEDGEGWKLISEVCHPNHTGEGRIHGSSLVKIAFITDGYTNKTGFEARIRRMCGGSLYDSDGIISISATEFKFMVLCEWNVTVGSGRTIQVEILDLNLEDKSKDGSCENYLLLKNGHYADSPILGIGKYCMNDIPQVLNTTGNYLYVKYFGHPGKVYFTLSYKELSQNCGGSMVLSQRLNQTIISSPNYPNIPPSYTECYWTIRAPPGESLRVDFLDRFDITISADCTKAAVQIRDGASKFSPLIGQFCEELPNSTFSSDNMINIRFFTNLKDPGNGFKARVAIASCGGIVRSTMGEVRSPNFNVKTMYPQNSDCTWHLIGSQDHSLVMKFYYFDLPGSGDCLSIDHVTIEEEVKFNDSINTIGVYCGNLNPGEIHSRTNEVIVRFESGNQGNNAAGFSLFFNSSRDTCGGQLNTESGTITSPGYPMGNYNDIECEWIIKVPEGRRITLEFTDLDLDLTGYNQGLVFYNDEKYKSLIKFNIRTNNTTVAIKSSANIMHVIFWSSKSTTHRGFEAQYSSNEPSICIGDFSKAIGVIMNVNESAYFCKWKRLLGESQTLSLSIITSFNLPTTEPSTCKYPTSAVIVTSENEKNEIAKICRATKQPVVVRSPYAVTNLIAFQNKQKSLLQYTVNYAVHACGGVHNGQAGIVNSPNYPQKYAGTIECAWIIKLPENQKINVNFANVDLDKNCEYNYIVIYNGETPTSPKIGHFCQNNKPTTLTIQGNVLLIEYHADERSTGTGFQMQYQSVIGGCGGIFHDNTRIIESPSYPKDYPNNAECTWEIISQNGHSIYLNFTDRFYIEESKNCENDFIEIWNYMDEWISLGRKCGRHTPKYINSTSNRMKIVFRSNDKITATGFKAQWSLHCGGVFVPTSKNSYIASPGYPNDYNNNETCVYSIISNGKYVNINFEDFALEEDSNCRFDNLTIMKPYDYENLIYCGRKKPPPIRTNENVTITFKTDHWISRRGFKILYKFDDCGGIINKPTVITSPKSTEPEFKDVYSNSIDCIWNITAPSDKNVLLKFIEFELEHNDMCNFDFVEAFDGLNMNETSRLATLCGNLSSNLPLIKSTTNSMTVNFKSDGSNNFRGFKAVVYFNYGPKAGCGGVVNVEDTKVVEAPFGLPYFDCQWEIRTTKDHYLKITFTEIHLDPCVSNQTIGENNCVCNLIEIKDGGPFAETIEKLCTNTIPSEISTTSNNAWLRLFTIGKTPDRTFKATFTKMPSLCGASVLNVTNQTKVLTSPGYPNSYPNNIRCKWMLQADNYDDSFDIRFTDIDLVKSNSSDFHEGKCSGDKIQIIDKQYHYVVTEGLGEATVFNGPHHPTIYGGHTLPIGVHEYCGKYALSFDHYSGENKVVIAFASGFNVPHGKGFRLEYRLAGCNRNFTSVQGRILLKNSWSNCFIVVTAPENYTISFYFNTFTLYDTDECVDAGVEVFDGDSNSAKKLVKLCGYNLPDPVFSTGNKALIHSWSNLLYSTSVDITYTSSPKPKGCGGIFYNFAGTFTSPLYPKGYREKSTCEWEVKVPQGMNVYLRFSVFDINGANMVITTYNKDGTDGTVHHYNENDEPALIRSENNRMTISYITTLNSGGSGWIAKFVAATTDMPLNWDY
ncbi:hypothetical protein FQR65_LT10359 [Abscondita terminalis]|nr:hypothetical protein FQR65_LT10359 [Abscondita terminalis]